VSRAAEFARLTALLVGAKGQEAGEGIAKAIQELAGDPVERMKRTLTGQGIAFEEEVTLQGGEPAPPSEAPEAPVPAKVSGIPSFPHRLPDPGLRVTTASEIGRHVGPNAMLVWLSLLAHADIRPGRQVTRIGYDKISRETGASRDQVRAGVKVLLAIGIITRRQTGRSAGGARLTAEYYVPFPTPARLARWTVRAEALARGQELAPDPTDGQAEAG
jgi:hypothetical protein